MSTLSFQTKLSYGLGQAVWGCKDTVFHILLLYHYQQNLGVPGAWIGLAAFIALITDALTDPLMGYISDRTKSRFGRRHLYMGMAVIPLSLTFYGVLNPPTGLAGAGYFSWYLCFSILARLAVTMFIVPHTAMAAEITDGYEERTSVFGFRVFFGYATALFLQVVILGLVLSDDRGGLGNRAGYGDAGLIVALVILLAGFGSTLGTYGQRDRLVKDGEGERLQRWYSAFVDIAKAMVMRNFRLYVLSSIAFGVMLGVAQSLILHLLDFYYQFVDWQKVTLMLMVFVATIPAYWLAQFALKRWDKGKAAAIFLLIGGSLGSGHVTLKLFDILPATGDINLFYWVTLLVFFNQTALIAYLMIQGSMVGDLVDEYWAATGQRQAGLFAAAQVFISKIPFGMGTLVAGLMLDIAGFAGRDEAAAINAHSLEIFGWLVGPGLYLVTLTACTPLFFYDLTKERLEHIRACLLKQ